MTSIQKITDFFLTTYLFIASASACLVLTTCFLAGIKHPEIPVVSCVFFSTLLIYNFHKVSANFDGLILPLSFSFTQLKSTSSSTRIMMSIAATGILVSVPFIHFKTLVLFFLFALITYAYAVPVLKIGGKTKRIREIFFAKIATIALIWSFSTVLIPLVNSGIDPFTKSSLALFAERFLFMFAICVPFEIRDMEQEERWGNTTLPLKIGETNSKATGIIALLIFVNLVYFQFGRVEPSESSNMFALPLYISAVAAAFLVLFSNRQRDQYYFRIFVDGTMHLQFTLVLLVKLLS